MTSNAQQSTTDTVSTGLVPAPLAVVWDQLISLAQEQQSAATQPNMMRTGSDKVQSTPLVATAVETLVETAVVTTTTLYVTVPAAPSSTASTRSKTSSYVSSTFRETSGSTTPSTALPSSSANSLPVYSLDITTLSSQTPSSAGFGYASSTTSPSSETRKPTINPGPMQTDSPSESGNMVGLSDTSRKAIVGGLAGAIAGLLIIGVILCIFIRRRQKRQETQEAENFAGEKGLKPLKLAKHLERPKPGMRRKLSDLTLGVGRNRSTPELPQPRTPSPVDGSLIRVSTEHWSRPFVASEGMRESLEPAPLRITNPDGSQSNTPRPDGRPGFLQKHSSALAAVFVTNNSRSQSYESTTRSEIGVISYPKPLHVTSTMSRKLGMTGPQTPSFRSNPSNVSLPIVTQQPPEDPFVASLMQATQQTPTKRRQSLAKASHKISQQLSGRSPFRKPPMISPWTGMANPNAPDPMAFSFERSIERNSIGSSNYSRPDSRRTTAQTIHTVRPRVSEPFNLVISPSGPYDETWVNVAVKDARNKTPPQLPPLVRPPPAAEPVVVMSPPRITVSPPKASWALPPTIRHQRQKTMSPVSPLSPTVDDSSPNWKLYEGT